ncbi:MAG: hypothetical protein FIA97_20385 [Methylococcaceae bacterium]|nr:hypothetical protein [Methylococcaceae bacterium]
MDFTESIQLCIERLEGTLSREFGGKGRNLAERLERADISDDLREGLREVVRRAAETQGGDQPAAAMELIFLCGQLYERLEAVAAMRLAEPLTCVQPDGNPSPVLDGTDLTTVAEFASAWRQFMTKVADFVLKLMLVTVVVVFIGLAIGLI